MKTKLFINNAWIDSSDQQTFERKHPVNSEVMTESANATVTDAIKAAQVPRRHSRPGRTLDLRSVAAFS